MADTAYQAKYLSVSRILWDASKGVPENIPSDYCEYLNHEYRDGDVSFASLIRKLDYTEGLEEWEIEEAIELLGKVNPDDWPLLEDVESVSVQDLLNEDSEVEENPEFVEDNLSTSEKVEKVLIDTISSVFGAEVSEVRSEKGFYPTLKIISFKRMMEPLQVLFLMKGKSFCLRFFQTSKGGQSHTECTGRILKTFPNSLTKMMRKLKTTLVKFVTEVGGKDGIV